MHSIIRTSALYFQLLLLLIFTSGLLSTAVQAQQPAPRYLTITAENDIYVPRGLDRHYTNGIRVGIGAGDNSKPRWYTQLGTLTPGTANSRQQYEFAFGQNIYTPEFYSASYPLPADRPYAGWLYTELSVITDSPGTQQSLTINAGIVGPAALGEPIQKIIHEITGDLEPAGWDHQLGNEPALLLRYRRSWFFPLPQTGKVQSDLIPRMGVNLGNVFTDAGLGMALRIGNHLSEQDIPARIQPGLSSGSSFFPIRPQQLDWMLYAELQGRVVLHNIFLDGNTFSTSLSVKKRDFVSEAATGFIVGFGQLKYPLTVAFSFVWRGREFELQQGSNSFGSARIGIQF